MFPTTVNIGPPKPNFTQNCKVIPQLKHADRQADEWTDTASPS